MKHTPEPWAADCDVGTWEVWRDFVGEDNRTYATRVCAVVDYENDTAEANAKRIVACVNVCATMTDAQVQALTDAGGAGTIIEALVHFRGSTPEFQHDAMSVLDSITDKWMELHKEASDVR